MLISKALTLICEYGAGTGDNATTFTLLGCCYRLIRLLGLDNIRIPEETADDPTAEEACRRLVWSCFILDSMAGSGVDANLSWRDGPPAIPLPDSDRTFVSRSRPERNRFGLEAFQNPTLMESLDLKSQIIYLVLLRTKVLRYVAMAFRPKLDFL